MTIADDLARWPRNRLARLLRLRPDLRAADDLRALARLATSPASTHAAVHDLPAAQRTVLEAVVLLAEGSDEDDLVALDPEAERGAVLAVLDDLRDRLLVADGGLRPVGMVGQYLSTPLGLGRPIERVHEQTPLYELEGILAVYGERAPRSKAAARELLAAVFSDTAGLAASFSQLPEPLLATLRRYDEDGPVLKEPGLNTWDGLPPTDAAAGELLAVGLLAVTPSGTVELPREIGLALRHPAVVRYPLGPGAAGRPVDPGHSAASAAAAVDGALVLCDALLRRVEAQPLSLLSSGGVGVKDVRGLAKELGVEPTEVATALALLQALGLVATTTKDLRLTSAERAWSAQDDGTRWRELVQAWLGLTSPAASSRKLTAVLSYAAYDGRVRPARERLLRLLRDDPGRACTPQEWLQRWHARWPEERRTAHDRAGAGAERDLRADVLAEACWLGLLVEDAASPLLVPLLTGDLDAALAEASGAGEERVIAQADLTLVCPGRPSRSLKLALDRIATVESSAQATVWRLSETSLTRAYDEGDTPEGVLQVLERYAGTVPQPMAYLVRDAHRRHGRARVGTATSYVLVDDDAVLVTALSAKGAAGKALAKLGVRRIAAGVAVSRGPVEATVKALRAAGVPAVPETPTGEPASATGAAVRRAPSTGPRLGALPVPVDLVGVDDDVARLLGAR